MDANTGPAEELLRKIQELEAGQEHLKQELSKLKISNDPKSETITTTTTTTHHQQRSHSVSPRRPRLAGPASRRKGGGTGPDAASAWKASNSASFRHSSPLQRESKGGDSGGSDAAGNSNSGPSAFNFTDRQYLNILQSMGQSVHIFDLSDRIIYWNRSAELLYGYSAEEALGQDAIELLTDGRDFDVAYDIVHRIKMGERWTGQFPAKTKTGERVLVVATNTPFYDDDGTLVGIVCVSTDSRPFQETRAALWDTKNSDTDSNINRPRNTVTAKLGLDSQQPLQATIASKISNLATKVSNKVKSRIRTGDNFMDREGGSGDSHHSDHGFSDAALSDHRDDGMSSGASTPRGDVPPCPFGVFSHVDEKSPGKSVRDSGDESEGKPAIHKIITSKAEQWMGKKGLSWPWKGNEREGSDAKTARFAWPWSHGDQDNESVQQKSPSYGTKPESHMYEGNRSVNNEAWGSWSSSVNVNSTSSVSSCGSTSSSAVNKVDLDNDCLDYEILWEDLTIGEQIGQGSCGTVYHAVWYGSQDVAVKVFSRQEYSDEVIHSFRQEVSLMKRLRHPNVLLFMGAVTSPQRLCIVTEFLPRGSLFRLLQRNTTKLDWRRRILMALDIARGVSYPKRMKAVVFLLSLLIIFACSEALPIEPLPQPHRSFKVNATQNDRSCSYTVDIRTSCSSTRYTRDQISLAFGDAYGNQVYAPRLDDPYSRTFESCSTDTYTLYGPCTYQICYLYLYRSGYDGWKPESVTVYGYYTRSISFYYNTWIPDDIWYGFNYCNAASDSKSAM